MNYDIIIIGGGPAGSSAAHRAAQLGAKVLVLEKKSMPRPKLCGGWVSRQALSLLPFVIPDELIEAPFRRMEITDGTSSLSYSPDEPLGVFVDRATFDQYLLERAQQVGAEVRWEKAVSVLHENPVIRVRTDTAEYSAGSVIICTGAAGDLVRTVREPDTVGQSAVCLEQRISVDYARRLGLDEGEGRFFLGAAPRGFGWILHHGAYLLVGVGQRRSGEATLLPNFRRLCERLALLIGPIGLLGPIRPTGHIIPLGGHSRRLGVGRCLLAGDAAGMVDAQSGEGIAGAIESGQLAACALTANSTADAVTLYTGLCERSLLPHLRWSRRFAWGFYHNPGWALRTLAAIPGALQRYCDVIDRRDSYPKYIRWLVGQRLRNRSS